MRKSLRGVVALAVSALALTSCLSKVSYADFHSAATSVEKHSYTKAKFSGKWKTSALGMSVELDMSDVTFNYSNSIWAAADGTGVTQITLGESMLAATAALAAESSDYTYYTGGGFKMEKTSSTKEYTEWNEYGLMTKITDGDNTLTVSYSK